MVLRKVAPILIAYSCLSRSAAQEVLPKAVSETAAVPRDFSETVVPITEFKIRVHPKTHLIRPSTNPMSYIDLDAGYGGGTGFCLDPACRFIGTNYHVALMGMPRKIKGERVVQQYLATGPEDEGATVNEGSGSAKYTLRRDLAIFELRHSLPNHHGTGFNLDDLQPDQEVDIYAYPKEGINPFRHLLQFHGRFKGETTRGLLAFDYSLAEGKAIHGGASGGIVVDTKGRQIVGILNAAATNGKLIAFAVPVQALADFVNQVQPYLAQRIFPFAKAISPVSADLYPKFAWPPVEPSHRRPDEPFEVRLLRLKAQSLVNDMRNFIAVQTFEWGSGSADKDPATIASYEIQVLDGHQRYCDYPDERWCSHDNAPFPSPNSYVPASEWSELPKVIGTEFRLRVHQAPDVVVNERKTKVFQWEANLEDRMCGWRESYDFLLFGSAKDHIVGCHGEVWTDEDTNILRISEHFEDERERGYKGYAAVVTYGWLKRPGETPRLIPLTISTQAENKGKVHWCRGQFINYRVFSSRVKIVRLTHMFFPF